jgi:hypothetical protein
LVTLAFRIHELFAPDEGLKDITPFSLAEGVALDHSCDHLRVSHGENENCLTMKKSIHVKDLVSVFSTDWNLEWSRWIQGTACYDPSEIGHCIDFYFCQFPMEIIMVPNVT